MITDEQLKERLRNLPTVPEGYVMPEGWQDRVLARIDKEQRKSCRRAWRWFRRLYSRIKRSIW